MVSERKSISFLKVEGLSNDFLLVDERDSGRDEPQLPLALRQAMCVRQAGVGANGVLTLLRSRFSPAVCRLHITNADGSVPEMCGNGLRCVIAALVSFGELTQKTRIKIDTDAGLLEAWAEDDAVVAEVGVATLGPSGETIDLGALGVVHGQRVSVGNPHFILDGFAAEIEVASSIGPALEVHPAFPQKTNVEFVELTRENLTDSLPHDVVKLVVWERGVGITAACGTGACATVASLVLDHRLKPEEFVAVNLPGGRLHIKVELGDPDEPRVWMRGPARVVFSGQISPAFSNGA